MLDILGFRQMIQSRRAEDIARRVEALFARIPQCTVAWAAWNSGDSENESGTTTVGHAQFSDTILIWTAPFDECSHVRQAAEVRTLFLCASQLLFYGFIAGLPLRGGIAFGDCYINEQTQTYLGPAIVSAHSVESSQEWIGAALDPSSTEKLLPYLLHRQVILYRVPVKTDSDECLSSALNWTALAQWPQRLARKEFGGSPRQSLRAASQHYLGANFPEAVSLKYRNAEAFIQHSLRTGVADWLQMHRHTRRLLRRA